MTDSVDALTDRLIDETYAATLDPLRYDALMDAWVSYIDKLPPERGDDPFQRDGMYVHFQRALAILDRMGRSTARETSAASIAAQMPGIGIVLDPEGRVIAMNPGAQHLSAMNRVERLSHLELDSDTVERAESWMTEETRIPSANGFLFIPCLIGRDRTPSCLLITPISLNSATDADIADNAFLLATVDIRLDGAVSDNLTAAFNLSDAETEVALLLANGQQPGEIAKLRTASVSTIRSQIRSILNKLKARNITDAVRTISGFAANYTTARAISRAAPPLVGAQRLRRTGHMVLRDGRRLAWTEQGDFEGRPILFFHNMLYGVAWTDPSVEVLARKGWRVISPSRPGFGASDYDPQTTPEARVAATVSAFEQLCDHLNLPPVFVFGHVAGLIYAQDFAAKNPDRVTSLLGVSHFPYWHDDILKQLPVRQRVVAATTRRAPSALGFVVRAGIALIDSGREDMFIHALHKDVPDDMRALRRPEVYAAIIDGLRHTVRQGGNAFMADCPLVLQDWTSTSQRVTVPYKIIHGSGDKVVSDIHRDGFHAAVPDVPIIKISGAGQYLLYTHWPDIIAAIEQMDSEAAVISGP